MSGKIREIWFTTVIAGLAMLMASVPLVLSQGPPNLGKKGPPPKGAKGPGGPPGKGFPPGKGNPGPLPPATPQGDAILNTQLANTLRNEGFTGRIQEQLEIRMGRKINPTLANLGRSLFFDNILGLNRDNSCAGCHSPLNGFGDPQPIAIGIQNNNIVGIQRTGPRNMRRSPKVLNTAFFPKLMWNSRFVALSNNPFSNRDGFQFPPPESRSLSSLPHLLAAQVFLPPTQQEEMAGFRMGADHTVLRNAVLSQINAVPNYRLLFAASFPAVAAGGPITFDMIAIAIAEFEISLTFANAPIDMFARGQTTALTRDQKIGALLFFGKGRCAQCHKVGGPSNEMFSDFQVHAVGVPQIVPRNTNSTWDGPNLNEDFGREQVTKDPADRYKFRTAPLRNLALQPFFFHDGAFNSLEDVVRHYVNVSRSARNYNPNGRVPNDLTGPIAPVEPILAQLDPILANPINLDPTEVRQLADFLRFGLLDPLATPQNFATLIPPSVPSGMPLATFR
jgi:cytochrome c peroxidase